MNKPDDLRTATQALVAASNTWGSVMDSWIESSLKALTMKASRTLNYVSKVEGPNFMSFGYYRSQIILNKEGEFSNLNLHMEVVESSVNFTIEHHAKTLERLAKVSLGYNSPLSIAEKSLKKALASLK